MVPVADRGLCHLGDERLGVSQQQVQHRPRATEFVLEHIALQTIAVSGALHDGPAGRSFTAHEQGDAQYSLVAYYRDFGGCAILHDIEQRHDARGREIDVPQTVSGFVKHFSERHGDQFQMRRQAGEFVGRQCGKEMVLLRTMRGRHQALSEVISAFMLQTPKGYSSYSEWRSTRVQYYFL